MLWTGTVLVWRGHDQLINTACDVVVDVGPVAAYLTTVT